MEPLTPADVKRWDLDAIRGVFQTASQRADTLQRLGDSLQTLQYMIVGPEGVKVSAKELVDRGILDEYGPPLGR